MSSPQATPTLPDVDREYEVIRDKRRIVRLLDDLTRERAMLTALLNEGKQAFSTAIVDLSKSENAVILDEFLPERGNKILIAGEKLWILGQLRGIKIAFQTTIRDSGLESGVVFHRIDTPESICHHQRRANFRALVSLGVPTPVYLRTDGLNPLTGQLRDLSVGGLSVILPLLRELDNLKSGTIIEECQIKLPSEEQISAKAEVRHMQPAANKKNTKVGLAFKNLELQHQRQIQRTITQLEREQLRKQPKDD
ncbi:flagellar brake protein [Acidihalobacter prosperus]